MICICLIFLFSPVQVVAHWNQNPGSIKLHRSTQKSLSQTIFGRWWRYLEVSRSSNSLVTRFSRYWEVTRRRRREQMSSAAGREGPHRPLSPRHRPTPPHSTHTHYFHTSVIHSRTLQAIPHIIYWHLFAKLQNNSPQISRIQQQRDSSHALQL